MKKYYFFTDKHGMPLFLRFDWYTLASACQVAKIRHCLISSVKVIDEEAMEAILTEWYEFVDEKNLNFRKYQKIEDDFFDFWGEAK